MDLSQNSAFAARESVLRRPEVHLNCHVHAFCEEYRLPMPLLYALIHFNEIASYQETVQAMTKVTRWILENQGEIPLSTMHFAELGNLLQFAVDCNIPLEDNLSLTYDDDDYTMLDHPILNPSSIGKKSSKKKASGEKPVIN